MGVSSLKICCYYYYYYGEVYENGERILCDDSSGKSACI